MSKARPGRSAIVTAALGGFLAGAIAMAVVLLSFSSLLRWPVLGQRPAERPLAERKSEGKDVPPPSDAGSQGVAPSPSPGRTTLPAEPAEPSIPSTTPSPSPAETTIGATPIAELRARKLEVPVRGIARSELHGTFDQARRVTENHGAIDILAPRHTPVVAVENGTIEKLFESKQGGLTVYQFDPSLRYTYYYAHLERYAEGLKEGVRVERGQVLGYVGTSGNAPKDTPHLHFAIFELTDKKQWWQGTPIDPFEVLK